MKIRGIICCVTLTVAWMGAAPLDLPIPEVVLVPAGAFSMGSEEGASWEKPPHRVETGEFWIGKRPVSNGEFRAFQPRHQSPGDDGDQAPVTGITWQAAQDYFRWLSKRTGNGYRLPREAEWEKAVRGGLEGKKYPWGDEPPVPEDKLKDEGFRPAERPNGYGVIAGGNGLWEWTADRYSADYYQNSPAVNPQGPASGEFRVLRGGGYRSDPNSMRNWNRGSSRPKAAPDIVTFRVLLESKPKAVQISESRPVTRTTRAMPAAGTAGGLIALNSVEIRAEGAGVIVAIATDKPAKYKTMVLSAPDRLVIDLAGTLAKTPGRGRSAKLNQFSVKGVRWAQFKLNPAIARIVVDMDARLDFKVDVRASQLLVRLQR
jgi:hypothetical protein